MIHAWTFLTTSQHQRRALVERAAAVAAGTAAPRIGRRRPRRLRRGHGLRREAADGRAAGDARDCN